jgi:hypothetical protein
MAQLTLTQRSELAEDASFRGRLFQALFSKANYFLGQPAPVNIKAYKEQSFAVRFVNGGANNIDIYATSRFWLANYNADPPELEPNGQPTDNAVLNTGALDTVYDSLAGVVAGDQNLPYPPL